MICRVEKSSNYTVMCNYHLRDRRLSLKAKGLLSVVLSLPEGWDYSIAGLCAICKESTHAVNSALSELKECGYLIIDKIYPGKSTSGRIEYQYIFREIPDNTDTEDRQDHGKQGIENQGLESQTLENPTQLNTNKSNTDKSITYNIYIQMVIEYLNLHAGTHYRSDTPETRQLITQLFDRGYSVADITEVIQKKVDEWSGTEFARYLRPSTLFGSRFESYLNAPARPKKTDGRYEPTFDISDVERQLDSEWYEEGETE